MHELPVVQSLLEITLEHAARHHARRVVALNLVIGQLSSIVDDCVQFYWDILARDTMAQGARLNFRRVPARFRCRDCGADFALDESRLLCPGCGGFHLQLLQGDEFRLESIDIKEETTPSLQAMAKAESRFQKNL
ncbi:MAG TPA: hydrogenase maturation nickel metallochaperone HypA [Anaerolineae bacterium]|nr:hydrogenase maturation nickel metallochaperone HypA [Anaerolineae bacterium]